MGNIHGYYTGYEKSPRLKRWWMMFSGWISINYKRIFK